MAVQKDDLDGRTYYEILGLSYSYGEDLALKEIKAAYHRALLSSHPDKVADANGDNVGLVKEAWTVLSNDTLRKEYDRKLEGRKSFTKLI